MTISPKLFRTLVVIVLACLSSAVAWGGVTRATAAETKPAFSCLTSSEVELGARLSDVLLYKAHPLMAETSEIPMGAEGAVIIANLPTQTRTPEFRIFISPTPRPWRQFDPTNVERHPIGIVHPAPEGGQGSYALTFTAPVTGGQSLLRTRVDRTIYVVACQGDDILGWGADELPFAPQKAARLWAFVFVLILYLAMASVVYLRRAAVARELDDTQQVYRIAEIRKWSFLHCLNPIAMTADMFDKGSLSKFQILFFLLLIAYGLAYLVIWKGALIGLSPSLVYLLGIPALGSLGSRTAGLTRDRLCADNWSWLVKRKILPLNQLSTTDGPQFTDLVMSDTELDLTKLQALTFTVIVAVSMWVSGPEVFATFNVPDSLLQVLGLSQLLFVGGRYTRQSTLQDLDGMVTELRKREGVLRRAAATGIDVTEEGKPLTPAPDAPLPTTRQPLFSARGSVPIATARFLDTADQVQVLLESLAHHSLDASRLTDFDLDLAARPSAKPRPSLFRACWWKRLLLVT